MDYKDTIDKVLSWYNRGIEIQQTELDILGKRTIIDYKNDMTRRLNGDISHLNLDIENPISFPIVRKVVKSYVSKVASNPVEMVVKSYNLENNIYNKNISNGIKTLLEWSNAQSNQKKAFTLKAFQLAAEGTVIEFEGFHDVRVKKKVFDHIDEKGQVQTKEQEHILERGCYTAIRPLEDILISNPIEEDIQKQSWIIDREKIEYEVAKKYYSKYPKFKEVEAGNYWNSLTDLSYYREDLLPIIENEMVELIHCYTIDGMYYLLANGVLLYENVIPYRHNKYPYAKTIHDVFSGTPFFYGRSMVEQIAGITDSYQIHYNLMIQKQLMSANQFILTENDDDFFEIDNIKMGGVYQVKDINKIKIDKFNGIDNSDISMLGRMDADIEALAGNPAGGANAMTPGGGRILLQQTLQLQEEAMKQIGYSIKYLEDGERERTELRLSNLLQFLSIPEKTDITGKAPLVYSTIRQENQKLSDGSTGMRIIKIIDKRASKQYTDIVEELDLEEAALQDANINAEAVAFSIQDLNQFQNQVIVVPKSSYESTQSLEMQKWMQYMQTRLAIMPESNKEELLAELDRIMDVDSDRFNPTPPPLAAQGLAPLQEAMTQDAVAANAIANGETPPPTSQEMPTTNINMNI
ncbi:MAG: hypothetical protein ACO3UU_04825 [Minisyncoccia bacterium]